MSADDGLIRIPIPYRSKGPIIEEWQHLPPWRLRRWIEMVENGGEPYNVGARLDHLVVVDCDTPEAVARWEAEAPLVSVYQSRGRPERRSFWYALPAGVVVQTRWNKEAVAGMAPNQILRPRKIWGGQAQVKAGPGHQCVIPPSVHPDTGKPYIWVGPAPSEAGPFPMAPVDFIVGQMAHRRSGSDGDEWGGDGWDSIAEGNRDNALTSLAGFLRRHGASEWVLGRALSIFNAEFCLPPLEGSDIERIARSVASYAPEPEITLEFI